MEKGKKKFYRDSSWNRPISGSKPKKLLPQNKAVNPSFTSKGINSLFFPDPLANPETKHQFLKQLQPSNVSSNPAIPLSTSKINLDTLARIQQQFSQRKLGPWRQRPSNILLEKDRPNRYPSLPMLTKMTFISDDRIRQRQFHGYNIITCHPN